MDQVEQTAPADSTDPLDATLDRMYGGGEEVQQEAPPQGEEQPEEQAQEAETQSDSEEEDFEFDGLTIRMPKAAATKLKSAVEGYGDYTKKTQEVADARRMVAVQAQQQQLEAAFQQTVQQDLIQKAQLEAAIKQYENVNWPSLDMETYIRTKHGLDSLKDKLREFEKEMEGKKQKFDSDWKTQQQQYLKQAGDYLSKAIPKWNQDVAKEILEFGVKEGFSDVVMQSVTDPVAVKVLWKALQWDKLQSSKSLTAQRAKNAPPVVKPGATSSVSQEGRKSEVIKQLHQAKDPGRKKELFDKALDLKFANLLK